MPENRLGKIRASFQQPQGIKSTRSTMCLIDVFLAISPNRRTLSCNTGQPGNSMLLAWQAGGHPSFKLERCGALKNTFWCPPSFYPHLGIGAASSRMYMHVRGIAALVSKVSRLFVRYQRNLTTYATTTYASALFAAAAAAASAAASRRLRRFFLLLFPLEDLDLLLADRLDLLPPLLPDPSRPRRRPPSTR